MDFLNYLQYGAIGIAMALAILTFRLLSKEQEREEVRENMMKAIKSFMVITVAVPVFFGVTELLNADKKYKEALDGIWQENFGSLPDSTLNQRINKINLTLHKIQKEDNEIADCESDSLEALLKICQSSNDDAGNEFYLDIIQLRKEIQKFGGSVNLEFEPENKLQVFQLLGKIFNTLEIAIEDKTSKEGVLKEWKKLKASFTTKDGKYINNSDILGVVKKYVDLYADAV